MALLTFQKRIEPSSFNPLGAICSPHGLNFSVILVLIVRGFSRKVAVGPIDIFAFGFTQPFLLPVSARRETMN
jgi:hypothetical protein